MAKSRLLYNLLCVNFASYMRKKSKSLLRSGWMNKSLTDNTNGMPPYSVIGKNQWSSIRKIASNVSICMVYFNWTSNKTRSTYYLYHHTPYYRIWKKRTSGQYPKTLGWLPLETFSHFQKNDVPVLFCIQNVTNNSAYEFLFSGYLDWCWQVLLLTCKYFFNRIIIFFHVRPAFFFYLSSYFAKKKGSLLCLLSRANWIHINKSMT